MHLRNRFQVIIISLLMVAAFSTCSKKWEDHNQVTDSALKQNLQQAITQTPNLGKFTELLVKSGFDKIISSSKNYTVWAPTDQALQNIDAAIVNDSAKLKQFVGNHISNQSYSAVASSPAQRIKMLNGKYIFFSAGKFDSASIVTANVYANNGILHVIDKFIPRMDNSWEFLNNTTLVPQMKSFLLSLNYLKFDPSQAIQTGVDPATGLPTYQPGTGTVKHNTFLDTVLNVNDESNQYTLLLLTDDAYKKEFDKLTPWFQTQSADSTNRISGYWLVKDLVFKGAYTAAQLPDSMPSLSGVQVPIDKSAIVASYRTSNGMVHIMNNVNFTLANKFPPLIIEGENPTAFSADRSAQTFYRVIYDSVRLTSISEIFLLNYNVANYNIRYAVPRLNSMRYNVSWSIVNDFNTTWQQRLAVDSSNSATTFTYAVPNRKSFADTTLGMFTIKNYRSVNLYVIGPTTASASGNTNIIALDRIKLTPAF